MPAAASPTRGSAATSARTCIGPARGRLIRVAQIVTAALLVEIILAGIFGSEEFASNPATVLVWVDLWVGLGLVAAIFGHVWDLVNPLRLLGDLVDRVNPQPPLVYPEALGQWPAVAALAAFGWMELAWPGGSHPFDLALVIVLYLLVQVIGMALVGAGVWLERAELFTAFSRLMARVSPFEWYIVSERPCPADLHDPGEVAGCGGVLAAGGAGRARHSLARLHVRRMARSPAPARRRRDDRRPAVDRALRRLRRDDAVHGSWRSGSTATGHRFPTRAFGRS